MNIKNLTNSPYELMDEDGKKVVLPARGEINGFKPHPMHTDRYKNLGYFRIEESAPVDDLRVKYKELAGKDADKRWSDKRVEEETAKLIGEQE